MRLPRLAGKTAFITGAGSGMGRATALLFAAEGAGIVGFDLDAGALEEVAASIRSRGGDMVAIVGDTAQEADVARAVDQGYRHFGRLDVLLPAAGVLWKRIDRSVTETDTEAWDRVMGINLRGPYLICKHGIPRLQQSGGGSIILIGSICALAGFAVPQDAYTSSKGALVALTRSLAVQFARDGIRANIIHPGMIATPMQAEYMKDPEWVRAVEAEIPLGRMGTAEEIARVALFLASDDSSYLTGSEILADGGFMAR